MKPTNQMVAASMLGLDKPKKKKGKAEALAAILKARIQAKAQGGK